MSGQRFSSRQWLLSKASRLRRTVYHATLAIFVHELAHCGVRHNLRKRPGPQSGAGAGSRRPQTRVRRARPDSAESDPESDDGLFTNAADSDFESDSDIVSDHWDSDDDSSDADWA